MTVFTQTFDGGSDGTALTTANSGAAGSSTFTAVQAGGVFSNTHPAHGPLGYKVPAASGSGSYARWAIPSGKNYQASWYMWVGATSASIELITHRVTSNVGQIAAATLDTAGKLRLRQGSSSTLWTSPSAFPLNALIRVELLVEMGNAASDGRARLAFFLPDSATAIADSGWITGLSLGGASDVLGNGTVGLYGANNPSGDIWFDTIRVLTDADYTGAFMGPFTTPLATPSITLGAATNPSTVGGTNGTQVVSWPSVSGAASYDAYVSYAVTPTQDDFTRIATGVTSPATLTGLASGAWVGIKANA